MLIWTFLGVSSLSQIVLLVSYTSTLKKALSGSYYKFIISSVVLELVSQLGALFYIIGVYYVFVKINHSAVSI